MDETKELVERLERARDFIDRVSGAALGIAMSGKNHPNPDVVLMDFSREGMELSAALRAALATQSQPRVADGQPTAALGARTPPEGAVTEAQGWRKPDFVYDPHDWECTVPWSDRSILWDDWPRSDTMEIATLFEGPTMWAACVPTEWDEDEAVDFEWQLFSTKEAAEKARDATPPLNQSEADRDD